MNNIAAIVNNMTIKLRSDGRYEGRITVLKRKSFYGKTKSEVKNKAKEYLLKIENGYREPQKIILNEYIEYWLMEYKWNKIEPSSYSRLYRVYENQIRTTIGKKLIGSITTKDIQKLIDDHANPPDDKIKPLAKSGLKRIIHLLSPCMEKAVSENIIQKNPCDNVVIPKESCIQTETKCQFSLTDEQIQRFRKVVLSKYKTVDEYISRDGFVLIIILSLGLRVGEALALTWNDVDLDNKVVYINKTIQSNIINFDKKHGNNVTYNKLKKSTKTNTGKRVLGLNENVVWFFNDGCWYCNFD